MQISYKNKIIELHHGEQYSLKFYIYVMKSEARGPWLDNGPTKREYHYIDKNFENDHILEVSDILECNDGGTQEIEFTSGDRLIIPPKGKMWGGGVYKLESWQFNGINLKDLGVKNEIAEKILNK